MRKTSRNEELDEVPERQVRIYSRSALPQRKAEGSLTSRNTVRNKSAQSSVPAMTNIIVRGHSEFKDGSIGSAKVSKASRKLRSKKQTKKSKSSTKPRKYAMSIDRIVQGKKVKKSKTRPHSQLKGESNLKNCRSSNYLPDKRLVTPSRKKSSSQHRGNSTVSKSRVSAETARNLTKKQQELVNRLHGQSKRSRTPMQAKFDSFDTSL